MKASLSALEKAYIAFNGVLIIGAAGCVAAVSDPLENIFNTLSLVAVAVGTAGVSGLGWLLSKRTAAAIALSNLEAKQASDRAAQAQRQALELQKHLAWRELNARTAQTLMHQLSKLPQQDRIELWIQFVDKDPEAVNLQDQLRAAFTASGYNPHYFSGWERAVGIKVSNSTTPTGRVVFEALSLIGLAPVALDGDIPGAPGPGTVQILVGSKPPPDFTKMLFT